MQRSSKPPKSKPTANPPNRRRQRRKRNRNRSKSVGKSTQQPANISGQASVAAAYATGQRTRAPKVVTSRDSVRIVHRELIGSVSGSSDFTVASAFALNPGLKSTFPWLSVQAQAWERYRFNSLKFEYYTRTGSNVPGSVMLAPDYDAADDAPTTEQTASSYEDVAEDAPWKDICCTLRPSALHALGPTKFIRTLPLSSNLDIKTYDAGNFFVCTVDGTNVNWGKLWVEYDITLFTPQLPPTGAAVVAAQHFSGNAPTSGLILGTAPVVQPGSSILATVANDTVTFLLPGKYLVSLCQTGTTVTEATPPTLTGATYGTILGTNNAGPFGSTTTAMCILAVLDVLAGATVQYHHTVVAGLLADLYISQLPSNIQ